MSQGSKVIVCQIGAREHYGVARTLHARGLLRELITDVWIPPGSIVTSLPGSHRDRLKGRYHADLADARVTHFTMAALRQEAIRLFSPKAGKWDRIISRNRWFQRQTVQYLQEHPPSTSWREKTVIAYSYAARDILTYARTKGAKTILAQIDGGQADEEYITAIWAQRSKSGFNRAPIEYWEAWLEECRLADRILVNSDWAKELLARAVISANKLLVTPVIFENPTTSGIGRHYPEHFDSSRPLRVLMLGALTIRKGVLEVMEAARELRNDPVEFTLVGADGDGLGDKFFDLSNVRRFQAVPRDWVHEFYENADVFVFPTHSDGFGMTQVEALSTGLPVLASRNCAHVVETGTTGLILDDVSGRSIASAVRHCLRDPGHLAEMSAAALDAARRFALVSSARFIARIDDMIGSAEPAAGKT
jgi:glycosyltransferase involved in cell wall biosynthesis